MKVRKLVVALAAGCLLAPAITQAQAVENPWMVRVRAVYLDWANGQSGGTGAVQSLNVQAEKEWIPELDITYFFTKNIATELVLTYPQKVKINAGSNQGNIGTISALPPSLVLQYHFTDLGAFKPYVGAGINYTIFSNRANFPALNNGVTVNQSSVGFVGQIGLDYMFDKNWGLNIDLKYITMSTDVQTVSGGTNLGTLTLNPWTPAVGVTYRF
ncbi:OmpW Outer membrane protein W [Burkholderiaceae bacterium]|jgi:outer membrane protein